MSIILVKRKHSFQCWYHNYTWQLARGVMFSQASASLSVNTSGKPPLQDTKACRNTPFGPHKCPHMFGHCKLQSFFLTHAHDTHNVNLWCFWHWKFAAILLSIHCNAFTMVPCTLPVFFIVNSQTSWFYHSTTIFIVWFFVWFCVATGWNCCLFYHLYDSVCVKHPHLFI